MCIFLSKGSPDFIKFPKKPCIYCSFVCPITSTYMSGSRPIEVGTYLQLGAFLCCVVTGLGLTR